MNFYSWEKNQALFINQFGMLEPDKTKKKNSKLYVGSNASF